MSGADVKRGVVAEVGGELADVIPLAKESLVLSTAEHHSSYSENGENDSQETMLSKAIGQQESLVVSPPRWLAGQRLAAGG